MSELYTVTAEEGRLRFLPRTDAALEQAVLDESPLPGCGFVSRLGDPGLLHCVVFRHERKPGGVFVVEDDNGLLFAAVAETNLAYAVALGRLGKMISYARYGADIFAENMLDDDAELFGGDIGLDSVDSLEIISGIDDLFGVDMTGVDREHFQTINALASYVEEHVEQ